MRLNMSDSFIDGLIGAPFDSAASVAGSLDGPIFVGSVGTARRPGEYTIPPPSVSSPADLCVRPGGDSLLFVDSANSLIRALQVRTTLPADASAAVLLAHPEAQSDSSADRSQSAVPPWAIPLLGALLLSALVVPLAMFLHRRATPRSMVIVPESTGLGDLVPIDGEASQCAAACAPEMPCAAELTLVEAFEPLATPRKHAWGTPPRDVASPEDGIRIGPSPPASALRHENASVAASESKLGHVCRDDGARMDLADEIDATAAAAAASSTELMIDALVAAATASIEHTGLGADFVEKCAPTHVRTHGNEELRGTPAGA